LCPGNNFTGTFTGTSSSGFCNPLPHGNLELEARVGIEQNFQLFRIPPKPFGSGDFSKCCTDKEFNLVVAVNQANNLQQFPTRTSLFQHCQFPF